MYFRFLFLSIFFIEIACSGTFPGVFMINRGGDGVPIFTQASLDHAGCNIIKKMREYARFDRLKGPKIVAGFRSSADEEAFKASVLMRNRSYDADGHVEGIRFIIEQGDGQLVYTLKEEGVPDRYAFVVPSCRKLFKLAGN